MKRTQALYFKILSTNKSTCNHIISILNYTSITSCLHFMVHVYQINVNLFVLVISRCGLSTTHFLLGLSFQVSKYVLVIFSIGVHVFLLCICYNESQYNNSTMTLSLNELYNLNLQTFNICLLHFRPIHLLNLGKFTRNGCRLSK